jgi:hypothetical protein
MNAISNVLMHPVSKAQTNVNPFGIVALFCGLGLVASFCSMIFGLDLSGNWL